jgi:sugar lactone lactonase YvrE
LAIRIDGDSVYVSDSNHRIIKTSTAGQWQATFPVANIDDFYSFVLATDSSGNIFVSFPNLNCVQKFDSSGLLLATIGASGSTEGLFNGPAGVALDSSGYVYVADHGNYRIQKFHLPTELAVVPEPPFAIAFIGIAAATAVFAFYKKRIN